MLAANSTEQGFSLFKVQFHQGHTWVSGTEV